MDFAASSDSTAFTRFWMIPIQLMPLLSWICLGDNQADRVLIESFEAAFALQILQMTHDRPSPQNAFVDGDSGVKWGSDRWTLILLPAMEPER